MTLKTMYKRIIRAINTDDLLKNESDEIKYYFLERIKSDFFEFCGDEPEYTETENLKFAITIHIDNCDGTVTQILNELKSKDLSKYKGMWNKYIEL